MKRNCWEFKKCGREPGGTRVVELGVCPASVDASCDGLNGGSSAGRICWAVSGTLCGGAVQGSFAQKRMNCMECDFQKVVAAEEGAAFVLLRPGQRAAEVLRAEEARYRSLFDGLPLGLYRTLPGGQFVDANPALVQVFGYPSLEDLLLTNVADLYADPRERQRWQALMEQEGAVHDFLFQARRFDGKLIWLENTGRAVRNAAGEVLYYEGCQRDVTRRKQSEEELERHREHLEKLVTARTAALAAATLEAEEARQAAEVANRAKSTFLAAMSHELRTPLTAIIGYSDMLQTEALDLGQNDLVPDLRKIQAAGTHLLGLINSVLDLAKIEAGKMDLYLEVFAVADLVRDVVAVATPLMGKNHNTLEVACPEGAGFMRSDLVKVRQCVLNLLGNASKFTQRGTVTLEVIRQAAEVVFRVRDTGIGMTPEAQSRLFQEFSQADAATSRQYGGTGLGLALCARLCRLMGGTIAVESEAGRGSVFTIRLPAQVEIRAGEAGAEVSAEGARPARPAPGEVVVLAVDDDQNVRDLMTRFLIREGYRVETAANGSEALRLARELHPAVITLDVLMPGMDGWSVLSALKSDPDLADIPVIVLTILDDSQIGYALGAADFLAKPVDRRRLLGAIEKHRQDRASGLVLVVDDDDDARDIMRRDLVRGGWAVAEAPDGKAGLERVAERRPDLILLDLIMPEMDGFAFAAQLRQNEEWREIPIVVVTSLDLSEADRAALSGYVERIVRKGAWARDEVLREIRDLVGAACARPVAREGGCRTMAPAAGRPAIERGARILLVDDNELNRDLISRQLSRNGYAVTQAADGEVGVEKARREQPDLVLMDLSLPGLDGWEATRRIKADAALARIPVIALTAHALEGDEEKALAAGCDGYDTKPIDFPRLLDKIEKLLGPGPRAPESRAGLDERSSRAILARIRRRLSRPVRDIVAAAERLAAQAAGGPDALARDVLRIDQAARQLSGQAEELRAGGKWTAPLCAGDRKAARSKLRHDLLGPLGVIKGFCDLAIEEARGLGSPALVPAIQDLLGRTCRLIDRMDVIVDFSGGHPGSTGRGDRSEMS